MPLVKFVIQAALGLGCASLCFLVVVVALTVVAEKANDLVVKEKISQGFRDSAIQYPGVWDVNDKRGADTFTDCLTLEVSVLYREKLATDTFDSHVYYFEPARRNEPPHHACTELYYVFSHPDLERAIAQRSYLRYWWGSAIAVRIALGLSWLSVDDYRHLLQILSFAAVGIFIFSFFYSYGRTGIVFAPLFLSILFGYGMLTFGRSLAHAPEIIVGLLMLSAYGVADLPSRSRTVRAFWYGLLGSVCVYFDLLNGNVLAIEILLCCQLAAPFISKPPADATSGRSTAFHILKKLAENSAFVVTGGVLAILIRIAGYSFSSHTGIIDVLSMWSADFSNRVSGNLSDLYPGQDVKPSWRLLLVALKAKRHQPFLGMLGERAADAFYLVGIIAWLAILPLCRLLSRRHVRYAGPVVGLLFPSLLVPAWYVVFKQHTIVHAWMTGRLISLFCGLGMSMALALVILAGQKSPRQEFESVSRDLTQKE
jgi:hypothetical protein